EFGFKKESNRKVEGRCPTELPQRIHLMPGAPSFHLEAMRSSFEKCWLDPLIYEIVPCSLDQSSQCFFKNVTFYCRNTDHFASLRWRTSGKARFDVSCTADSWTGSNPKGRGGPRDLRGICRIRPPYTPRSSSGHYARIPFLGVPPVRKFN